MSLLGKVLLVLNLLGAAGLTYLAGVTYATRVSWQQSVFRHDLSIKGLPVTDEERDAQGNPLVYDMTGEMVRDVFSNAGPPVKTQVAEVKRVQELLEAKINATTDPRQQLAEYARILLPFSASNLQRETFLAFSTHLADAKAMDGLKKQLAEAVALARKAMVADPKLKFSDALATGMLSLGGEPARPFEEGFATLLGADASKTVDRAFTEVLTAQHANLKKQFDSLFGDALAREKSLPEGTTKERPLDEHRAVIAHLLFNLVEVLPAAEGGQPAPAVVRDIWEVEGYRRCFAVVGLQSAVKEINTQALVLAGIRSELTQEIARDRSSFAVAHNQILNQILDIGEKVDRVTADAARAQQQATAQAALVAKRKKDVADAEAELIAARKATAARLQELVAMRNSLFNIRVEVREATLDNQKKARKIAELEDKAASKEPAGSSR